MSNSALRSGLVQPDCTTGIAWRVLSSATAGSPTLLHIESDDWRWRIVGNSDGTFSVKDGTVEQWLDQTFESLDSAQVECERINRLS